MGRHTEKEVVGGTLPRRSKLLVVEEARMSKKAGKKCPSPGIMEWIRRKS